RLSSRRACASATGAAPPGAAATSFRDEGGGRGGTVAGQARGVRAFRMALLDILSLSLAKAGRRPGWAKMTKMLPRKGGDKADGRLEHREIAQQREDADDDDDELDDLAHAAVDRQALHQIEDQDDDEEGDQDADEY